MPRGTNRNTPTSRSVRPTTSPRAIRSAASPKRKPSVAPRRPSTRTTAAGNKPGDRDAASRQEIPPRTRAAARAAPPRPPGPSRPICGGPRRAGRRAGARRRETASGRLRRMVSRRLFGRLVENVEATLDQGLALRIESIGREAPRRFDDVRFWFGVRIPPQGLLSGRCEDR